MSKPLDDTEFDPSTALVIEERAASDGEVVSTLVSTVATESGTDATALPPLAERIDPDVLNDFVDAEMPTEMAVSFEYYGFEVVVTGDGFIRLRSLA